MTLRNSLRVSTRECRLHTKSLMALLYVLKGFLYNVGNKNSDANSLLRIKSSHLLRIIVQINKSTNTRKKSVLKDL